MSLVLEIVEIKGQCPAYKIGDRIVIENGFKVDLKKTTAICMHSLASIMPYYVAMSKGVSSVELGLSKQEGKAYVQCLDPCERTEGGTVVFEIKKLNSRMGLDFYYAELGTNCIIQDNVVLGLKYNKKCKKVKIGNNAIIRSFSVIYADVIIGDDFTSGHRVTIRENTRFGNKIVVGTGVVIDGNVEIGDRVKIETNTYIPTYTKIGSDVFIGPNVVMTNDKYPQRLRDQYKPEGPIIEDGVSIGANSTILPGVKIGEGSFIAAGSVVTKDVPLWSMVKGGPGKVYPLPKKLRERNRAKKW